MILLFALAAVTTPAWPGPGYQDFSSDDSRLVMREVAKCMVGTNKRRAARIVEISPADSFAWKFLIRPDCLPNPSIDPMRAMFEGVGLSVRARPIHYRYALAEALLHQEFRRQAPLIVAGASEAPYPALADDTPLPAGWPGDAAQWTKYVEGTKLDAGDATFGECVVRASPEQSWALLASDIASPAEMEAFKALTPVLAGCLKTTGVMPKGKFNVRGTIALNVYRLTHRSAVDAGIKKAAR